MRLEGIKLKGLGPFREEVELDVSSLPGPLVAITGANGAGKSTLLELFGGAMFRECPTRGKLTSLATDRAAFVEARVVNGSPWTIRQTIDAVSGKGEALVLDADGAPVLPDSKVRSYDGWAAKVLPAPEVVFSSIFQPQGSAGFVGMKPAERKSVLLRALGVERYEAMAQRAREKARAAKSDVDLASARLDDYRDFREPAACEADLTAAQEAEVAAQEALTRARQRLEADLAEVATAAARISAWEAQMSSRASQTSHVYALDAQLADVQQRIANNESVLTDGAAIRDAVERLPLLEEEVEGARGDVVELERRQSAARGALALARQRREAAWSRMESAHQQLAGVDELRAVAARLERADELAEAARDAVAQRRRDLESLQALRVSGAEERVHALRTDLGSIAHHETDDPYRAAAESLARDNDAAERAVRLPQDLRRAQDALAVAEGESVRADAERVRCERAVADLVRLEAVHEDLAAAQSALDAADAAIAEAEAQDVDAEELAGCRAHLAKVTTTRDQLRAVARRAGPLEQATARLEELRAREGELRAQLAELHDALAAPAPERPADPPDVAVQRATVRHLEGELSAARTAAQGAQAALTHARAARERVGALTADLRAAQERLSDWTRVAADLGRDGIQAMLIDAAGPELTEITNELLHSCHGPRWTVSIETQRLSADGKRTLEGCEVRVLDTERGRDAAAETLSGGERVIVGEAVALALATVACRRAGVERPTLVRDESGAALDPENAEVYVRMLRRAAALTGSDRVLFVSHSEAVQALADSRVVVENGKVEVAL